MWLHFTCFIMQTGGGGILSSTNSQWRPPGRPHGGSISPQQRASLPGRQRSSGQRHTEGSLLSLLMHENPCQSLIFVQRGETRERAII